MARSSSRKFEVEVRKDQPLSWPALNVGPGQKRPFGNWKWLFQSIDVLLRNSNPFHRGNALRVLFKYMLLVSAQLDSSLGATMPILKVCYPWLAHRPHAFRPLQDLPTLSASNAPAWWDFLGNSTAEVSQFQPNINLMALGHKLNTTPS